MPPQTNVILIGSDEYFKFTASKFMHHPYYSRIVSVVVNQLNSKLENAKNAMYPLIYFVVLILFGTAHDIWEFIKYEVIGIPKINPHNPPSGHYSRNEKQPVMHCPVCGAPGKPNGYTKRYTHQYICSKCGKHFTENTSLERHIVRYIILVKAVELFRYGLSNSAISSILGISRDAIRKFITSANVCLMESKIRSKIVRTIRALAKLDRYVLVLIDTTFFGEVAVILIKVSNSNISIYLADGENIRSVRDALEFLKKIEPELHSKIVFLQDGSLRIYRAIREYFKESIVIRQFHNPESLGIVHVHFTYNGEPYTLVLRWDYFTSSEETMAQYRGALKGELLLNKDELVLYEGEILRPNHMIDTELQRLIDETIGFGLRLRDLPNLIEQDHSEYLRASRDRTVSVVARSIREFQEHKKYVERYASNFCKVINESILEGLQKLRRMDFERLANLFLLRLYRSIKSLTLCKPSEEQRKTFIELKQDILRVMEDVLKRNSAFSRMVMEDEAEQRKRRKTKVRRYYGMVVFRGTIYDEESSKFPQLEYALGVLKRFFDGKYITTNIVEGHFGRVKSSMQLLRNVGSMQYLYLRFTTPSIGTTNRFLEVLELLRQYSFDAYFGVVNNVFDERDCDSKWKKQRRIRLRVGATYRIRYKNRYGEEKEHTVYVESEVRRRGTAKDTYYRVKYLDADAKTKTTKVKKQDVVLRGDRVRMAKKINLRISH